ncbi:glycogen synthase [Desulfosporosinus acididurans]|uniref:Glycogen synthase n=1 Tax=Desulfosporosinus acididurans TaxID=476652 RepID=A0A0J1FX75_9FIRM|nr:glycosyltransferase family 4 protein [Desulfosporosinus acididurans]KLU67598.1 glycogen synthase [Desulfosporosinus acididurans]
MKIVIPAVSLEKGGGARFLYQVANALIDRGQNVEFVMPQQGIVEWPVRAKITRVKELSPKAFPSCDFILPNFYSTVFPAWQSKKGKVVRLSLVYEPLCVANPELSKATYSIDAPIVTISQWQRQLILSEVGRDSSVISGGVDSAFFHPSPKLSARTGQKTIFYILRGPGYSWKGNSDFLEACKYLKERFPNFTLLVVNPEEQTFETTFPYTIMKAKSDQEMALLYARADLFVYASYYESFGLPPLEAMACGTAVITTDCGGNRDYTRNGENCIVIQPSDVMALTEAMYHLLTNDNERQRFADAGQTFAKSWTWQRTADQLISVLKQL